MKIDSLGHSRYRATVVVMRIVLPGADEPDASLRIKDALQAGGTV